MGKYRCANSVEEIKTYIGNSRVVAFDFETAPDEQHRGEDKAALDPAKAHIVGCSFSVCEGTGIYVPIKHLNGKNVDEEEFFAFLRDFLSDKNIIKVAHNLAFESAMAYTRLGVIIQAPVYDTICAAQLVNNGDVKFRSLKDSGLKQLTSEQFGEDLPTFEETTKGAHFDELYANDAETVRYGSADSDFALRLYYRFNEWFDTYLPKHRNIVEKIESPAAVYIGIMRANGLPINRQLMEKRGVEAESEMARIRNEIKFLIGDVEIGASCSTKAFKDYLYRDLELPILKTTESGSTALDDETLMLLQEWCNINRPELSKLFSLVQEYRRWGKIKSSYIDGYFKHINSATGRIHPDMLALSTETGRMCCRNPNAQNMPRNRRKRFSPSA